MNILIRNNKILRAQTLFLIRNHNFYQDAKKYFYLNGTQNKYKLQKPNIVCSST